MSKKDIGKEISAGESKELKELQERIAQLERDEQAKDKIVAGMKLQLADLTAVNVHGKRLFTGDGNPKDRLIEIIGKLKHDPHTLKIAQEMEELLPEYSGIASDLGSQFKTISIEHDKLKGQIQELQKQIKQKSDEIVSLKTRLGE